MKTDTSEKGLESLIVTDMTAAGWTPGASEDYNREYAVDLVQLQAFIHATQAPLVAAFNLDEEGPVRRKFLARLQGEITKRGVIDVLRSGIKHGAHHLDLFYGTPSPGNPKAIERFGANRFSVTRQLKYSRDETQLALDLGLFINGLADRHIRTEEQPHQTNGRRRGRSNTSATAILANCCSSSDAVWCISRSTTARCASARNLKGKASWFLPFNQGWNDGAGNPPNPDGLKTDYLWKRHPHPARADRHPGKLCADRRERRPERPGRKKREQIFPRYHQLDVVRRLLADAGENGAGKRYLIQHSAGSGKSNSIAWLAHQLIGLEKDADAVFDSIIVVTDRRILDQQIRDTIKQFAQVGATVGPCGTLRRPAQIHRRAARRSSSPRSRSFRSSSMRSAASIATTVSPSSSTRRIPARAGARRRRMSMALSESAQRKRTRPSRTKSTASWKREEAASQCELFRFHRNAEEQDAGDFRRAAYDEGGQIKHRPFHSYTMKQAIQEGFILDVLKHYTPVDSYYKLVKKVESDPEFDTKRAKKKLRRYVESHDHAIRLKAEIMVDHFHEQVLALNKIGGQARAMVVTQRDRTGDPVLSRHPRLSRPSVRVPTKPIVAFSGEHEYGGAKVTEASLNGFPSSKIADRIQEDPYRFLDLRRQVPDRLRRAAAAHDVCGQAAVGHQGGANPVAA